MSLAEDIIDQYIEATGGPTRMAGSDLTPWQQEKKKRPKWKGGKPEMERYGLAGLPGGTADWGVEPGAFQLINLNKPIRR
ncbi:MAG: hypothetical protein MJA83_16670 [Gammaproteobacteria bacterium]|nr:hypothetical protein [Gammaproteobacteria bacterium]